MDRDDLPFEQFDALSRFGGVRHAFTRRAAGVDLSHDKPTVLRRLDAVHREIRHEIGVDRMPFITAEQVHGDCVAVVDEPNQDHCFADCDGLVTNRPNTCLGIYVADCCAVYLLDPVRNAIGLVHSGRKGTERSIASIAVETMSQQFGSNPAELVVQLSPCIRPPHYEVDFAAEIVAQCKRAGVRQISDSAKCTACDLRAYYSYRAEKGKTGRMLALLAITK